MKKVYIVDGSRTPQLKAMGKTGPFSASALQSFPTIPAFPPSMEVNIL